MNNFSFIIKPFLRHARCFIEILRCFDAKTLQNELIFDSR